MSYFGWKPYVPVAKRREKAEKAAAKMKKAGKELSPIPAYRGAIAKTFWGKSWCDNLERYSDFANRLPRGRTYVRNGAVIDLRIAEGEVHALVMGSSLYQVTVSVAAVPEKHWHAVSADCAGSIDSLVALLQGKLSKAVMERICIPQTGLFPAPREINFTCNCPDWASICKHVAAVLYGVGARLDAQPELMFALRRVDAADLVKQAGAGLPKATKKPSNAKVLNVTALADVFGIEMEEVPPPVRSAPKKAGAMKDAPKKKAKPTVAAKSVTAKKALVKKAVPVQKPVTTKKMPATTKTPASPVVRRRRSTENV